ncbi:putative bifunctional diguanylate cyclase/phosphodiesterase [Algicola sagamiensis]|uniref:putative bifunctional diguanylate cyclase/phosphodiesterase n=1 Tax=Algicola sagamiensis TaxID=163869 RepID=UPI000360E55C|nr:EAL domain-containing protein [Algicola sagamiensis]
MLVRHHNHCFIQYLKRIFPACYITLISVSFHSLGHEPATTFSSQTWSGGLSILFLATALMTICYYRKKWRDSHTLYQSSLTQLNQETWEWHCQTGLFQRSNKGNLFANIACDGHINPPCKPLIHPEDLERVIHELNLHLSGQTETFELIYRMRGKQSQWLWVLDKGQVVERDEQQRPILMLGTIQNITQLKEAQTKLSLVIGCLSRISDSVIVLDHGFRIIELNISTLTLFNANILQLKGYPLFRICLKDHEDEIKHSLKITGEWQGEVCHPFDTLNKKSCHVSINSTGNDELEDNHYIVIIKDLTEQKAAEAQLRRVSRTDALTGLPNRSAFLKDIEALTQNETPHALLLLDLNDFKKINDTMGHEVGDQLIVQLSQRFKSNLPKAHGLYRLGGDEFAVLMSETNDFVSITHIAREMLKLVDLPFLLHQQEMVVAGSVGIGLFPEDGSTSDTLLRNVDTAMYCAKEAGISKYVFFSKFMNQQAVERLQTENLIRQGLKEHLFQVYYQPKMSVTTGELKGMEALVRFICPQRGSISPASFIPIAEETGQIIEIGEVVLEKACRDLRKWQEYYGFQGRVAINLSAQQFNLPDLSERCAKILHRCGVSPQMVELEITEGAVMKSPEKAIATMFALRKMGIHLSMDDFGTGYSSLSYLKRFPINTLKIDKAFVDDMSSENGLSMVKTILSIARNLGLEVVAEGVETDAQYQFLKQEKCEFIQGYYYSQPLSMQMFESFLQKEMASQASADAC